MMREGLTGKKNRSKVGLVLTKEGFTPLEKSRSKRLKPRLSAERSLTGFSTLEMLIAFAVITLSITSVILVSFGNQSATIDTDIANDALYIAESELEHAQANAIKNFISINSTSAPALPDGLFNTFLAVSDISECVKRVTSGVAWQTGLRNLNITLTSIFISQEISEALGNDCIVEKGKTSWKNPATLGSKNLMSGGSEGTDIDVVTLAGQRIAFVTSKTGTGPKSDLWAFDVTDASNPVALDDIDVDTGGGAGLNTLDVAGEYIYAVGDNPNEQLQIFRFNSGSFTFVATSTLPGVSGSYPEGQSVYFYNDRLYVGVHETAGHEFHVFDVSDPANPLHLGSLELTHNIHKIVVRDNYAYIASSGNGCELIIIDVSDPGSMTNPCPSTVTPGDPYIYDAEGSRDAMSLFLAGNRLYLGRKNANADGDIYILDVTDQASVTLLGLKNLDDAEDFDFNGANTAIEDIVVTGNLMFLGTSDKNEELQIWNVEDPTNITNYSWFNLPAAIAGLDFNDDLIFTGIRSNDALHVIFDDLPTS